MPANTPLNSLPYPLPSEPVAEGAQAIRNLAEAVDKKLTGTPSAAPPASPVNGQLWALDVAPGIVWVFRYNSSSASAYKWEFVGGAPIGLSYAAGGIAWNNAIFTSNAGFVWYPYNTTWLTTRPGDYNVTGTQQFIIGTTSTNGEGIGVLNDITLATNSDVSCGGTAANAATLTFQFLVAGVAAGKHIGMLWRHSAGTTLYNNFVSIQPRRIS